MILDFLVLLHALANPPRPAASPLIVATPAAYLAQERAVDNWRIEGAFSLDLKPMRALRLALGVELRETPRCVRLNNYWCVKRAGWKGEIAADAEGHVAFASAREGASATALLLRRYYLEFKRRTAHEIAARWAPAQCGFVLQSATAPGAPSLGNISRMLPQRPIPMGLAPHGIGNTLRARWLAAHGRGGVARRAPQPSRIKLANNVELAPAPEIATGMGEPAHLRPAPPSGAPLSPPAPILDCFGEKLRIDNYAAHIAEGVATGPDQDLALFTPDGKPTDNLAKVMANMAAVEIGPLRARATLVDYAVAQLRVEAQR